MVGYFQYCGMEGGTPCHYRQIICNIPPLWDFLISPDFHRGGRFRRQILSLSFVPVLSYVYVNILFQGGYFYVGLWGTGWYFLPENPTFFVRRNRKIPHTQHTTKIKHANHGDVRHCLFCHPWHRASTTGTTTAATATATVTTTANRLPRPPPPPPAGRGGPWPSPCPR